MSPIKKYILVYYRLLIKAMKNIRKFMIIFY